MGRRDRRYIFSTLAWANAASAVDRWGTCGARVRASVELATDSLTLAALICRRISRSTAMAFPLHFVGDIQDHPGFRSFFFFSEALGFVKTTCIPSEAFFFFFVSCG